VVRVAIPVRNRRLESDHGEVTVNQVKAANVKKHKCPKCGCKEVRRSQMRGLWERGVLRALGVRAYRCDGCDHRYYDFKAIEVKSGKLEA
jgi:hypothetical protein